MRHANFCEISRPLIQGPMKLEPLPAVERWSIPESHRRLAKVDTKRDALDVAMTILSQHGLLSGFAENHPEAYKKLQEMRGR